MSTDTYGVRVLAREGATVTFRAFNVYGDWRRLPDPVLGGFWVHVACDGGGQLRREVGDRRFDEAWLREHAWDYVEGAELLEMAQYCSRLRYVFYYERGGQWIDEQHLPQAVIRVTYSDARWVDHLEVGASWGTTGYEPGAPERSTKGSAEDLEEADLPRLAQLTGHADAEICARAIARLGETGPAASPWSRFVARRLEDRAPIVKEQAHLALSRMADATAVASLACQLWDDRSALPVLRALARMGPAARVAADPLRQLTRARTSSLRSLAEIAYFSVTGESCSWKATEEALRGNEGRTRRERAFDALITLPEPARTEVLPMLAPLLACEQGLPWWTDLLLQLEGRALSPAWGQAVTAFAAAQSHRPAYLALAHRVLRSPTP